MITKPTANNNHWTSKDTESFIHAIAHDFIAQLEDRLDHLGMSQAQLADTLNVTEGRVSQIFNNPGNLTLELIVKYAQAIGMKVTLVPYDDQDHRNERGPINSSVFLKCWEVLSKPVDLWPFENWQTLTIERATKFDWHHMTQQPYFTAKVSTRIDDYVKAVTKRAENKHVKTTSQTNLELNDEQEALVA